MKLRLAAAITVSMLAYAAAPAAAQSPWPQAQPQAQPDAAPAPWPQPQAQSQAQPEAAPAPWPQAQPQAAQPAWGAPPQQQPQQQAGPNPWAAQPPQQEQMPPCLVEFVKLRGDVEKRGGAIKAAGERKEKPSPKEACGLFNSFTAAEAKMLKYASGPGVACGIPPQILENMKQAHAKSTEIRARVCQVAAAGPPRPAAPSLSDALSAPVTNSDNIKTGRGTFDTLTGTPLGK